MRRPGTWSVPGLAGRSVRAAARRHPRVVDAALAVLVTVLDTVNGDATGLGWLWVGAVSVPLVWRRRAPVVVCWLVFGLVWASALVGGDGWYLVFAPLVAIYTVARHRPRRHVWLPAVALEMSVVAAVLLEGRSWTSAIAPTAVIAAAVLLGMNLRTRAAYLAELEERNRLLERGRDQQLQLAVAAERARIAREMHDIVAHNLTVMVTLADGAGRTATTAPARAADTMKQVSATGREALEDMRRLLGVLHDGDPRPGASDDTSGLDVEHAAADLTPQPGLDDLDQLVDQVRAAGLRVAVTQRGTPGTWGPGAGLAIYRIVQEALTNTIKHAGAGASADVRLRYQPHAAAVTVIDDGANRPSTSRAELLDSGHGLAGMRERAATYGGAVRAGPRRGPGWYVHAHLRFDDITTA
jgi:signal transduction histidine kinase